jgi:hypothetical protein
MSLPAILRRDAAPVLLLRQEGRVRSINDETRTVEFDLSSEAPVNRWGDIEILRHDAVSVRLDRLRTVGALHLYHDVTQPVAMIKDAQIVDKKLRITAVFGQTQLARDAFQNVKDGVFRGVSAGYVVHKWEVNADTRTYTGVDWEPFEGSLTTIPADPTVGIGRSTAEQDLWCRSITPSSATTPSATPAKDSSMKISVRALFALCLAYRHLEAELASRAESGATEIELRTWAEAQPKPAATAPAGAGDEAARATELANERTARQSAERTLKLTELARAHGVNTEGLDLRSFTDEAKGIQALLERKAQGAETRPLQPVGAVTVTADGEDKRRAAAVDGLIHSCLSSTVIDQARRTDPKRFAELGLSDKDLGMRRFSPQGIVRRSLPELTGWEGEEIALFATRQFSGLNLRDANQTAANFTAILSNFADKAVLLGYMGQRITHSQWTSERRVKDFRPVSGAALQAGLLKEQLVKGSPAEEINLLEKSYQASLGLFLRSATWTYQDWRNDDLGQFAAEISQLGLLAALTEDWQVYKLLMGQTWTGYLTTGAAFWDDANDRAKYTGFGKAQGDLENRSVAVGDESIPIQPVTRTVIVPVRRRAAARAVTGQGPANLLPAPAQDVDVQIVASPWLANASLTGNSADDYYLIAGNMDSIKVLRDLVNPLPSIRQVDAGATPDQKFLIMHAFRAAVATQDSMQKAQWA